MNELRIFQNTEFGRIRTIIEGATVLFCGRDVAAALGYSEGFENEVMVTVWAFEYQGEKHAEYRGRVYTIYRDYLRSRDDRQELYLGQKAADKGEKAGMP